MGLLCCLAVVVVWQVCYLLCTGVQNSGHEVASTAAAAFGLDA